MGYASHLGPMKLGTVKDGAGANMGGVVVSQAATVTFADTSAKNLFIIPAGSRIVSFVIDVTTAFNSSGTDLLDIGTTANGALYVNDADVSSTGHIVATLVAANLASVINVGSTDVQITATYAQSVADAAAGSALVSVVYEIRNPDGTTTVAP